MWDNDVYAFLNGDAPPRCTPACGGRATLRAKQGLYEVVEGIYQVRGFDLSNISFIEGDTGVIVIDPADLHRDCRCRAGPLPQLTAVTGPSSR